MTSWHQTQMGNYVSKSVACRKSCSTECCTLYGESCSIECRLQKIMFRGVTYSYGESCSIECRLKEIMFLGVTYSYGESCSIECRLREIMFRGVKYSACGILFVFRISWSLRGDLLKEIMLCDICYSLREIISIFSGGSP